MLNRLETLDLQFQDQSHIIASYLLPHEEGVALIETGPGSTFPRLQAELADRGLTPADVTEVLLTHVHLDHAGAAGHLAEHGATIHVHHVGAPHLVNPHRLLSSAEGIYGDDMERLWGEMRPVPEDQLVALEDGDPVEVGNLRAEVLDTPGHASHHMSYAIGAVCFTGDVGGVRLPDETYVEAPLPPPEIRLDLWRESLVRLRRVVQRRGVTHLAPTHFGLYDDVEAHLERLQASIEEAAFWTQHSLPDLADDTEALQEAATKWFREQAAANGVDDEAWARYELANPSWTAALGLRRYWRKHSTSSASNAG